MCLLQEWQVKMVVDDPRSDPTRAVELHTAQHSLIYCFTKTIDVYGRNVTCPNKVIRLPAREPFTVEGEHPWTPETRSASYTFDAKHALDIVHSMHLDFEEGQNSRALVDYQLIEAKKALKQYKEVDTTVIKVEKDFIYYVGVGTIAVLVKLGLISFLWTCYKYSVCSKICMIFCSNNTELERNTTRNESGRALYSAPDKIILRKQPSVLSVARPAHWEAIESA